MEGNDSAVLIGSGGNRSGDRQDGEEDVKEGDEEEDNEKGLPLRAWKETTRLYWEAVVETKVTIDRILGCGGLQDYI